MGGLEFNPMAYPFFPSGPGGPGGRIDHNPNFQDFRPGFPQGLRDGQGDIDPQFQNQNVCQFLHFPTYSTLIIFVIPNFFSSTQNINNLMKESNTKYIKKIMEVCSIPFIL
jgi:hypothetical protein